jgi:peptidyl-prolyl cis-trans isomerase A (cyclophilin A)
MAQQRATSTLQRLFRLGELFRSRKIAQRPMGRRLGIEELEDRSLMSANTLGSISGTLFVDPTSTGTFLPGETTLPGVAVTLSGMSSSGAPVNATVNTDANGNYTFGNVPQGNYQVSAGAVPGVVSGPSPTNVTVGAKQSLTANLGSGGLAPESISLRQFLSTTTSADFANLLGAPGSGFGLATPSPIDTTPFITLPIADVMVAKNTASTSLDLAKNFGAADITTSSVRFNTTDGPINMTLFDASTPQTVANFYDYINSGAYTNVVFSRLITGFILQGGALQVPGSGTGLQLVTKGPMIDNEFGTSNTTGTIAMALAPGQPNSATDEFFFNLADNNASGTTNLDAQKFTVFGTVADSASLAVLNTLASHVPTSDESKTTFARNTPVNLANIPLINYAGGNNSPTFPGDTTLSNYLTTSNIAVINRPDFLTYSVIGNTNPALVSTSITNEHLTLNYTANMTGSAVITVRAMNQHGEFTDTAFNVTVQ